MLNISPYWTFRQIGNRTGHQIGKESIPISDRHAFLLEGGGGVALLSPLPVESVQRKLFFVTRRNKIPKKVLLNSAMACISEISISSPHIAYGIGIGVLSDTIQSDKYRVSTVRDRC